VHYRKFHDHYGLDLGKKRRLDRNHLSTGKHLDAACQVFVDVSILIFKCTPVSACASICPSWNSIPSDLDPSGFFPSQPLFNRPNPENKVCESSEAIRSSLETKEEQTFRQS
jgi:hypothetical protein